MEREDIIKFTNSIVLLSKLLTKLEDGFLKQKLHGKLSDMVSAFIEQRTRSSFVVRHANSVAQYHQINLLNSINNLLDYLEYLAHISKSDTTPLLITQRNLLKFKLHILKLNREKGLAKGASEDIEVADISHLPEVSVTANIAKSRLAAEVAPDFYGEISDTDSARARVFSELLSRASVGKQRPTSSVQRKNDFSTETTSKARIFNYIKKTPDVRTKDIMSKFSTLSGRTVKRSLKELTDEGFLRKKSDGVAVYYTCG